MKDQIQKLVNFIIWTRAGIQMSEPAYGVYIERKRDKVCACIYGAAMLGGNKPDIGEGDDEKWIKENCGEFEVPDSMIDPRLSEYMSNEAYIHPNSIQTVMVAMNDSGVYTREEIVDWAEGTLLPWMEAQGE